MTPNLQKLIPPIDELGRAKRIQVEHKLLDRILNDLDNPELDHAEFRGTMRDYCELKKQDNLHEKNVVLLTVAEARPSRRPRLRDPQDLSFGAPPDSSFATNAPDESPSEASECQLSTVNCQLSSPDPDVDPEWSLAPWGRRKNGKPRTEKEYRTILYRAVRDVYGLDMTHSSGQLEIDASRQGAPQPTGPPPSPPSISPAHMDDEDPADAPPWPTRQPPPEEPFLPKINNPWYYF